MMGPLQGLAQKLGIFGLILLLATSVRADNPSNIPAFELETEPDYSTLSIANRNILELKKLLPLYQSAIANPWGYLSPDLKLKPGIKNIAIMALRAHLKATGDLNQEEDVGLTLYDKNLLAAVKRFQARHGLASDGVVGADTISELNISPDKRLQQIQLNIDRWTKLSSELIDRYILVNIPDYQLKVIEYGHVVFSMKAVVGKPERQTPEINSTITRLVINPYWNIPKLIAQEDIVPKVLDNPNYLDEMNIKILDPQDRSAELDSRDVDWSATEYEEFPYHLRQQPGSENALGLVKFEFPNSKDIYMHDTPAKNLFNMTRRAFSSGCIRLEKPFELVQYLMQDDLSWTNDKLEQILATNTPKYIKASRPTRVIITYITAWVDEQGVLQFRDDLYGLDGLTGMIY